MIPQFGPGQLLGRRTDIANATPVPFGNMQEVSWDFSFTIKELQGQYQFPIAIARGAGKITGKAKSAIISGLAFNALFFGQTLAAGQLGASLGELHTIPATTPFTILAANSGTFKQDFGVVNTNGGIPLTKVLSAPATGQYSVDETVGSPTLGTYTFASADANGGVALNYANSVAGTGEQITITNQLLGTTPTFSALFKSSFNGKAATFLFNRCTSSKLGFGAKSEDWETPEFDFSVFADDFGNIGTISLSEAS
jgi:hypothetical protein